MVCIVINVHGGRSKICKASSSSYFLDSKSIHLESFECHRKVSELFFK